MCHCSATKVLQPSRGPGSIVLRFDHVRDNQLCHWLQFCRHDLQKAGLCRTFEFRGYMLTGGPVRQKKLLRRDSPKGNVENRY